jgi:hypothetical protein
LLSRPHNAARRLVMPAGLRQCGDAPHRAKP